jgi:hypothetical protein
MSWLAVNKDGQEMIFQEHPKRTPQNLKEVYDNTKHCCKYVYPLSQWNHLELDPDDNWIYYGVALKEGSIQKLIGKTLSWADEPAELI